MRLVTLFNGEIVLPPRRPYVHGVDVLRPVDAPTFSAFADQLSMLVKLCEVPHTPFTNHFHARTWQ